MDEQGCPRLLQGEGIAFHGNRQLPVHVALCSVQRLIRFYAPPLEDQRPVQDEFSPICECVSCKLWFCGTNRPVPDYPWSASPRPTDHGIRTFRCPLMPVRIESRAEPIPGYKLLARIGGGGFGEVWKAEAPGGLHKAIKFVYGDLQTAGDDGARAEQELKALSRVKTVRHPYILSLERYDIIDGQLIIVMELADRNLWDRFKECRADGLTGIPREELLRYVEESAEALDLMNIEYQLQHLDIKPQNIFLTHNHVKV